MATTYTVTAGNVGTASFTLTANEVDTVNFAEDLRVVDVVSDGAAAVWYTLDGSSPTVGGAGCYYIPAGGAAVDTREPRTSSGTVVKLISAGAPVLRVQRGD